MESTDRLRLIFDLPVKTRVFYRRCTVPDYTVRKSEPIQLLELYQYLGNALSSSSSSVFSLLPIAICSPVAQNSELVCPTSSSLSTCLPLVAEEIWNHLVRSYPYYAVKIVLEVRSSVPTGKSTLYSCFPMWKNTLKKLDMRYYFPRKLLRRNVVELSKRIFEEDCYIEESLRRGVWLHLLGVFHPGLQTEEERDGYLKELRRVYDYLKNKRFTSAWDSDMQHLKESIRRDAIRTDPAESFMNDSNDGTISGANLQKLIDIIMLYTLEHPDIKYTQGMTDLLSPILYVMDREADAYICYAAMFQRISENFGHWCEGALNKLERLKHLCEVLDPELFHHLTRRQTDDPFVLFFGMVLIECRREFNFQDSLHLMEVLWAASLNKTAPTLEEVSRVEWAGYMTSSSPEVVQEVFENRANGTYAAEPLCSSGEQESSESNPVRRTSSSSHDSFRATKACQIPVSRSSSVSRQRAGSSPLAPFDEGPPSPRERSSSLPETHGYDVVEMEDAPPSVSLPNVNKEGSHILSDEENRDSIGDMLQLSSRTARRINGLPSTNEMSDLSSLSSANSNGVGLVASYEGGVADQNAVIVRRGHSQEEGFVVIKPLKMKSQSLDIPDEVATSNGEDEEEEIIVKYSDPASDITVVAKETGGKSSPPIPIVPTTRGEAATSPDHIDFFKSLTLPREKRGRAESGVNSSTLPRRSHEQFPDVAFSLPAVHYLHQLSNPSMSSPYVSAIRPLDRINPMATAVLNESGASTPDTGSRRSSFRHSPLPPFFAQQQPTPTQQQATPTQKQPTPTQQEATPTQRQPTPNTTDGIDYIQEETAATNSTETSAEAQIAQTLSNLASTELSRPVVNLHASLKVHLDESFSLFVCLAILVSNRAEILSRDIDFIGLSMLLNSEAGNMNLSKVLSIARELSQTYHKYQSIYWNRRSSADETSYMYVWLDDLSGLAVETDGTTPLSTPSSVRRSSSINRYDTGTSCSINTR